MQQRQQQLGRDAVQQLGKVLLERIDPAVLDRGARELSDFFQRVGEAAKRPTDATGYPLRWQDKIIEQEIPVGSSVLDLGCGNGELLARLIDMKQVRGQGVELDPEAVLQCVERGVPVFQTDLDAGLKGFSDGHFDFVVLEETLQTLRQPVEVLQEMLRVGKRGIVTFPNFGYWRVRVDLALRGRMPKTEWLPHEWFNTPNIHLFTIQDFLDWAGSAGVKIVDGYVLDDGNVRELRVEDNLYAEEALLIVEQQANA